MKFEVFGMDFSFAKRVQGLRPSAIREIFKYAADPEVVSLSAGNPAPEAFPVEAVRALSADILQQQPIAALQYSVTEGSPPLRAHLTAYMQQKHGIGRAGDDILITSGAQQAMEMVAKVLCNFNYELFVAVFNFNGIVQGRQIVVFKTNIYNSAHNLNNLAYIRLAHLFSP